VCLTKWKQENKSMCVRERERESECICERERENECTCGREIVCECVCVWERERVWEGERERKRERETGANREVARDPRAWTNLLFFSIATSRSPPAFSQGKKILKNEIQFKSILRCVCRNIGLYCGNVALFRRNIELICEYFSTNTYKITHAFVYMNLRRAHTSKETYMSVRKLQKETNLRDKRDESAWQKIKMLFDTCCSTLPCVATCCSVWQCVASCWSVLRLHLICNILRVVSGMVEGGECVEACCSVLQYVVVCCSVM